MKNFRALPNDLDARVTYPKEDKNGEKAALIKVVTTETGFEFEAGMIGLVATVNKTGEIWVYVPRGSKALTIKHARLGVLRNYPYPEPVESGAVYEMTLVTGRLVTTIAQPEITTQWLVITSDPLGADLYLNDKPAGKTPYQNELPVEKYTWRLSKELYLPEAGVVELTGGTDRKVLNVKLKPDFGRVNLTSTPESGATVSLDGIALEKVTPCVLEMVKSGDHAITLSLDMYETATQRFPLAPGENKTVNVTMNPTFAEVNVTSDPAGDIYINGTKKGSGSWKGRLNPGIYTFEAKLDKHRPAIQKNTVAIGQPLDLVLKPEPITGTLRIITNPYDATVKLDRREMGKTPVTLKNLLIGEYSVELILSGYATRVEKTIVTEGQISEVNFTLQSGMRVEVAGTDSATLYIDNIKVGILPYSDNLTFGSHRLRIEKYGKKQEKSIDVSQGGNDRFTLNLSDNFTESARGLDLEMIFLEGSVFHVGSNYGESDEKPVHEVRLNDYYLGKREVTQRQWKTVMGNNPSSFKNCDQCPVENVSWNDIKDFLRKLNQETGKNYRLPTEAEWEYAARGGKKSGGYKYSGSNTIDDVAWYGGNSGSKTHPVAQKRANELGLYDMSGNVWEWCSDRYGSDYYAASPVGNPAGPSTGSNRVRRGGSWDGSADYCRTAYRLRSNPDFRISLLGFRLVLVP